MKSIIVNILILILMFNIIMIIFPEGKTQKFCRITIKIFIMIYILDNIFLNGSIDLKVLGDIPSIDSSYEREVSIGGIDRNFIELINVNLFDGEDVVKNITLNFTENMDVKAVVSLNKFISNEEVVRLKAHISEICKVSSDNVEIE